MGRRFVIFWLFAAQSGNLSECIHDFSSVHHKSHAATMKEKILGGRQKTSHTPGARREIAVHKWDASSTNSTLCAQPCYHQTVETHSCVSASCQVFAIGDFIRQSCLPRRKNASLQLFVELTLNGHIRKQLVLAMNSIYFPRQNKLNRKGKQLILKKRTT